MRGESCIYFAFEESPSQMIRNMRSLGIDLERCRTGGCLHFNAARPSLQGLDTHLATMQREVDRRQPTLIVVDPISALLNIGSENEVHGTLLRMVDMLKMRGITAVFTSLDRRDGGSTRMDSIISSLIDTWIALSDTLDGGEANRTLHIRKSRGMAHSNQLREFRFTGQGIRLLEPYLGPGGAMTGSARLAQEARDAAAARARRQEIERRQRELDRKRADLDHQIAALRRRFASDEEALQVMIEQQQAREQQVEDDREAMGTSRRSDAAPDERNPG
jgi:circadian clock protein KaiC